MVAFERKQTIKLDQAEHLGATQTFASDEEVFAASGILQSQISASGSLFHRKDQSVIMDFDVTIGDTGGDLLIVHADATFNDDVTIGVDATDLLTVNGPTVMNDTLDVNAEVTMGAAVTIDTGPTVGSGDMRLQQMGFVSDNVTPAILETITVDRNFYVLEVNDDALVRLSATNALDGATYTFMIEQDNTGGRNIVFAGGAGGAVIHWPTKGVINNGTSPDFNHSPSGQIDILQFWYSKRHNTFYGSMLASGLVGP